MDGSSGDNSNPTGQPNGAKPQGPRAGLRTFAFSPFMATGLRRVRDAGQAGTFVWPAPSLEEKL